MSIFNIEFAKLQQISFDHASNRSNGKRKYSDDSNEQCFKRNCIRSPSHELPDFRDIFKPESEFLLILNKVSQPEKMECSRVYKSKRRLEFATVNEQSITIDDDEMDLIPMDLF